MYGHLAGLAVAGLAVASPGEIMCPAGAAACAKDSGCHAFGVHRSGSFQLHGCAIPSGPNFDWEIFVSPSPARSTRPPHLSTRTLSHRWGECPPCHGTQVPTTADKSAWKPLDGEKMNGGSKQAFFAVLEGGRWCDWVSVRGVAVGVAVSMGGCGCVGVRRTWQVRGLMVSFSQKHPPFPYSSCPKQMYRRPSEGIRRIVRPDPAVAPTGTAGQVPI